MLLVQHRLLLLCPRCTGTQDANPNGYWHCQRCAGTSQQTFFLDETKWYSEAVHVQQVCTILTAALSSRLPTQVADQESELYGAEALPEGLE